MMIPKFPHLLHGGDYNPDQWLEYPEILEKDIELLKKAHINCVSLAIFAWATLEPEEGVYHFDWLEKIIDRLYREGIYTVLATPSAGLPRWLTEKYPEILMMSRERVRDLPGRRANFCPTSPIMREKIGELNRRLAERFSFHPGVIMWHISNELGGNSNGGECHCPLCQQAFREWLRKKYGTLDNLNHAWWTRFWSHTYTNWDQIESEAPNGAGYTHGLHLDWRRFSSEQMENYCLHEMEAVRSAGENLPITTNMMTFFKPYNYFRFAKFMDVISWDSYPSWHMGEDEYEPATEAAFLHDMMRSLKHQPFLLMESAPSVPSWKMFNTMKRPGMHMLSSMQAIAHGSNSIQYFQIRKGRGSFEKLHGAVIGHQNNGDNRIFRDVTGVGERLEKLSDSIYTTCNHAKTAIIFDWENWWAVEDAMGPMRNLKYKEAVLPHYDAFWNLAITTDILDMEQDLSDYKIVIAPMLYMLKQDFADRIREFVKNGGTFVTTYWSGIVNENDLCYMDHVPGLISDVLGISEEELDVVGGNRVNSIEYQGKTYPVGRFRDVVQTSTAKSIASYQADYYKGMPAITVNQYGAGKAYYLSAEYDEKFLTEFYRGLASEAEVESNWKGTLPHGVTVSRRDGENRSFLFVQNFREEEVSLPMEQTLYRSESGEPVSGTLSLKPFECAVLTETR